MSGLIYPPYVKPWNDSFKSKLFDTQPHICKKHESVYWEDVTLPEQAKIEGMIYERIKKLGGVMKFSNPYDEVRSQAVSIRLKGLLYYGFRVATGRSVFFDLCVT
jgi:hypothetical protein